MATFNGLPIYNIKIDDSLESNTGIDFISLVDFPAIETNWVAMAQEKMLYFNKEKQLLAGPILIPNQPIYRASAQIGEYYVRFSKEEIEKMVRKFQSTQKSVNLNYQHQEDSQIKQSVVQEIWLTGKSDKSKDYGFNLPEGSAFVVSHIGDSKFWNEEVKSGNVKGYSIEGFLNMELKNIKKMSKEKFVSATTKDGMNIQSDGETFIVGATVYTVSEDETQTPVPDGIYEFDNGMMITVADSVITELVEGTAPAEPEMSQEEMAAIEKAIKPILEKLEAKIAELEVKLSNVPAKEEPKKEEPKKPESKISAVQSALSKLKQLQTK
jgi:hypothetical protein